MCDKPLTAPATATAARRNLLREIMVCVVLIFDCIRRAVEGRYRYYEVVRKQRELRNKFYSTARFNELREFDEGRFRVAE